MKFECEECYTEIDEGNYCNSCNEWLEREKEKKPILEKIDQLICVAKDLDNAYFKNNLKLIKDKIIKL